MRHGRRRPPLRYPADTAGVMAPYGWVATPGMWHVRRSGADILATRCGRDLVDGLSRRAPDVGEVVCRSCVRAAS